MASSIIPDPSREVVVGPSLSNALEERVLTPARAAGSDLSVLAVTEPPPPVEYQQSPSGTWWLATNSDLDPVALSRGGMTKAPPEIVHNLRSLRQAGVDFDFIFVLHELPAGWEPGKPMPKMELAPTGPSPSAPVVAFQEKTWGLAKLALGAVATAASSVGEIAAYDPVILGGIKDPDSDLIAWVGLAAWDEVAR